MPLCLMRLWRHRLWDELKDLSHCRHGCFFICWRKREESHINWLEKLSKSSARAEFLGHRKETSLTSCSCSSTAETRGPGPISKRCDQHKLHTCLSPAVNWCHRQWTKPDFFSGRWTGYIYTSQDSLMSDLLSPHWPLPSHHHTTPAAADWEGSSVTYKGGWWALTKSQSKMSQTLIHQQGSGKPWINKRCGLMTTRGTSVWVPVWVLYCSLLSGWRKKRSWKGWIGLHQCHSSWTWPQEL